MSWIALAIAVLWMGTLTGEWHYINIFTQEHVSQIAVWQRFIINILIVIAVIIPAAQWPFQRWLIESVAAPTPVSAIMHAGIVTPTNNHNT